MNFILDTFANLAGELVFAGIAALFGYLFLKQRQQMSFLGRGKIIVAPDGKRATTETSDGEIWLSGPEGFHNVTNRPALDEGVLWSHDSRRFAFISTHGGDWNVWVYDRSSKRTARLTNFPGPERPISWNVSGDLIVNFGGSLFTILEKEIGNQLDLQSGHGNHPGARQQQNDPA